jgi:hypothetical protein
MDALQDAKQVLCRGEVVAFYGSAEHILDRILKPSP